jgi:hypothetical protein
MPSGAPVYERAVGLSAQQQAVARRDYEEASIPQPGEANGLK